MKRLNPLTNKPFKQGDIREDGFIFRAYNSRYLKNDGFFVEEWMSLEKFKKHKDRSKKWQKENIQKHNKTKLNWARKNPQKTRAAISNWQKNNPEKHCANQAKRRSTKIKRTPNWLTKEHFQEINFFYDLAKELTKNTKIEHHVDHIIPLNGKTVSGLHVPWNLQVLTKEQNLRKGNSMNEKQKPVNDKYRKNWDDIFKKKEQK